MSPVQNPVVAGDPFEVNIFIANMSSPGLFAYQLVLTYDHILLEAVDAFLPEGHFLTPSSPENLFVVDGGKIDNNLGRVSFAITLLCPEQGKTGDGILATVKFKAIADGNVAFQLNKVVLVGPTAAEYTFGDYVVVPEDVAVPEFSSVAVLEGLLLFATFAIVITKKVRVNRFT
jgi:hypothetical protein